MYGHTPPFRPGGGGRGASQPLQPQQQQVHLNPNFFPNPNLFLLQQNPNLLAQFNPFHQNPNGFPQVQQQFPNINIPVQLNPEHNGFQAPRPNEYNNAHFPQQHAKLQNELAEKVDKAAKSAWKELLNSNKNVSAWKVSQAALLALKAESWESLGFQMQQVPSLKSLLVTEGKINAFIHCFVAARRITSLYDLEVALCESEGVKQFEELELGPLVQHPLAVDYFSLTSNVTAVYRIRTEEIVSCLCEFIDTHKKKKIKVNIFLDFICKKQSVGAWENLCVRIQDFGLYVDHIKLAKKSEDTVLEKCYEKIRADNGKRSKKRPLFTAQKKKMDEHFSTISQRVESFSSDSTQFCGTHIRFFSSSSEDDDSEANQDEKNADSSCNLSLPSDRLEHVSRCPYPSATEERRRLGLKIEVESTSYTPGGGVRCDMDNKHSRGKRRYENMSSSTSLPRKLPKKEKFDADAKLKGFGNQSTSGHLISLESLRTFITTWKETCRDNDADEIVAREAIPQGPEDSSFISSLVNWVLPYAQRYIFKTHPDKYFQLKQSRFENLKNLKIIVVEKLFYRYKIKKCDITSKRKHQCNCLLQENILYCCRESDSHSIFLELSCLLFDGTPQLHFANFLHMITTMARSGATEEQTEFFILNSQKLPKLPAEESSWSLQSVSSLMENNAAPVASDSAKVEMRSTQMPGINLSNWPPADWKTAPGFDSVFASRSKVPGPSNVQIQEGENAQNNFEAKVISLNDISSEMNIEANSTAEGAVLAVAEVQESQSNLPSNFVAPNLNLLDSADLVSPDSKDFGPSVSNVNDQILAQQALLTGRLGELVAFNYITGEEKGGRSVKWVNEAKETGLPYDILLEGDENTTEYVEVKATRYERKNWFLISIREWQFAIEKGESFSIAHVVLGDDNMARVTIYKNPALLCQLGNLKLAVVVPKQ